MREKVCISRLFIFLGIFLIVSGLFLFNGKYEKVEAAESLPRIAIVGLEHSPFIEGDENEFYIASKDFTGEVQYQLFYTSKELMGDKWALIENDDMENGWTKPSKANEAVKVDLTNLNLEPSYYRFAIRVRRVGFKGKYENSYGDYDNAYPFMIAVKDKSDINLNGDMITNKIEFENYEKLIIDGVVGVEEDTEYKLHLYDIKNNRWIGNLTEYNSTVEYGLSNIQPGKYLVDIWGRRNGSSNKYDGWKLKIIDVKEEKLPKIAIVGLEHSPFVVGDENEFYIASKNFDGEVQYQLFYTNKEQMGDKWEIINDENMVDGWTKPSKYNEPVKVDLTNLNLKAGYYRFAIRVRRVGYKGKYENSYGDYDNAYPFMISVLNSSDTQLNGDMVTNKTEYKKNDTLVIDGVKSEEKDTQYKLHLYDVDNNKWLGDLTEYKEKVEYDLSNISEGTYLVDIWSRESGSNRKYEGWKLKLINVTSEFNKVTNVNAIEEKVWMNAEYKLPERVLASMQDGTTQNKLVQWKSKPDTAREGTYLVEGTMSGYDKKVKVTVKVIDGTGNTSGNIVNTGLLAEKDNWIYYYNTSDDEKLYKYNKDTEETVKMVDHIAVYINVVDDWIYYANFSKNGDGAIYKLKTDGSLISMLNNDVSEQVVVKNDWIYYANASEEYKLYKIDLNGGQRTKINDDTSLNVNVKGEYIYYTNISDNNKPYRIKTDGTDRTKLGDDGASFLNVYDGYIYYANMADEYKIYKMKTDGTGKTKIGDDSALYLNVYDGWIYYTNLSKYNGMYRMKIDGTMNTEKTIITAINPQVVGDSLYFIDFADELERMDTDGSEYELFGRKITKINDITKTVYFGEEFSLPRRVHAQMAHGNWSIKDIVWDAPEVVDTNVNETLTFYGTVKGYSEKIKLTLSIIGIDHLKEEVTEVTISKHDYTTYSVDGSIKAIMENRTEREFVDVTWNPPVININEAGIYTSEGTIEGYDKKKIFKLNVIEIDHLVENPIEKTVPLGAFDYVIPETKVVMSDGSIRKVPVIWSQEHIDTSKIGEHTITGEIRDVNGALAYDGEITYKISVVKNENTPSGSIMAKDGEWIYYQNIYDKNRVYRIKSDGTEKTAMFVYGTKIYEINDGWIYYGGTRIVDGIEKDNGFYRLKVDLSENIKIANNNPNEIVLHGNYVYYFNKYPELFCRTSLDEKNATMVYEQSASGMFIKDEHIYFTNLSDGNKVYRMNMDGTEVTKLSNSGAKIKGVVGDWIYYLGYRDRVYRIKTDGTEETMIYSENHNEVEDFGIKGDWIYLLEKDTGYVFHEDIRKYSIYKVKLDGSEKTLLHTERNKIDSRIYVNDQSIVYSKNDVYYIIKTDGTDNKKLTEYRGDVRSIYDGWIYYYEYYDSLIYKVKFDGSEKQIVL